MQFNINEINKIINSLGSKDSDDFQLDHKCWKLWLSNFMFKNSSYKKDLTKDERLNKLKDFQFQTHGSEAEFKKWFPNFKYDEYISPYDYNIKIVSTMKIKKIAFELQEHIPLEYEKLCKLLKGMYWVSSTENWSFEDLSTALKSYDKDLYLSTRIYLQMKNNKLVA